MVRSRLAIAACVAVIGATALEAGGGLRQVGARTPPAPAPVQALAQRLGIHGASVVGDQKAGSPRPWTFVLTRPSRGVTGYSLGPRGRVLSSGPRGALDEFHYFDASAVPFGTDSYRGPRVTPSRAIHIARAWLRAAGATVPRTHPRVVVERTGTTYIGGTGFCCFLLMEQVYWPRRRGNSDLFTAPAAVYVADGGTVVQADVNSRAHPFLDLSVPCHQPVKRDTNRVALGPRCFDYGGVAESELSTHLAGHHPEAGSPEEEARTFALGSRIRTPPYKLPLRAVLSTPGRRVYSSSYLGLRYRLTLIPAFPTLANSEWELVDVEHH